ncbi:hypothetical protein [Chryseobacterium sp. ERMR1:04]|uniref:hypothetical protein n=1 Tax=Chryseobacterium sp. ERMR1:04 TaxID=1705393 RepID=UPI000AEC4466|nr:hypothetical protein [Chryseobacterium sp. ERMR1:04]
MKKILLMLCFSTLYNSQIKFHFFVQKKISSGNYLLKLTIINETNDFYALPLDKSGFKAYYLSEYCEERNNIDTSYRYFSPTIMIKETSKNELLEASSRMLDIVDDQRYSYMEKVELNKKEREKVIFNWMYKNNIDDILSAKRNFYLMNNLLLLKPKENISYNIELDINEILRSDLSTTYDYYILGFNNYSLSLDMCINKNIYLDLTKSQKIKLKKYKLFSGLIKSNYFSFEAYK